jgi:hypothetical protein
VLNEESQVQKDKGCIFSLMWKIDTKDKHLHRNKHDNMQTHRQNMFVIVELLYGTLGRRERKRE